MPRASSTLKTTKDAINRIPRTPQKSLRPWLVTSRHLFVRGYAQLSKNRIHLTANVIGGVVPLRGAASGASPDKKNRAWPFQAIVCEPGKANIQYEVKCTLMAVHALQACGRVCSASGSLPQRQLRAEPMNLARRAPLERGKPACRRSVRATRAQAQPNGERGRRMGPLGAITDMLDVPGTDVSRANADTMGSVDDDLNRRIANGEFSSPKNPVPGLLKPFRKALANFPGPARGVALWLAQLSWGFMREMPTATGDIREIIGQARPSVPGRKLSGCEPRKHSRPFWCP